MQFKLVKSPNEIGVEGQSLEVKFAHCILKKDTWTNVSYFSVCRDFMGDVVYANETKKPVSIYGFKYKPTPTKILDSNTCNIGIHFPNLEVMNTFILNFPLLSKMKGIFKPLDIELFYGDLIVVITLDKLWDKTTFGMSYITFILKCLCYKLEHEEDLLTQIENYTYEYTSIWTQEKEQKKIKEAGYVTPIKELLQKLPNKIEQFLNKQENSHGLHEITPTISDVHNGSGFYSTLRWKKNESWQTLKDLLV